MRSVTLPGEMLREEFINPRGLSIRAVAAALLMPISRLSDIIHGRRSISATDALRLARYFGTTPQFWLNLQSTYDLAKAVATAGSTIQKEVVPYDKRTIFRSNHH